MHESIYNYYEDQGHDKKYDISIDDVHAEVLRYDETYYDNEEGRLCDESHFDFEVDDSDNNDYSEVHLFLF